MWYMLIQTSGYREILKIYYLLNITDYNNGKIPYEMSFTLGKEGTTFLIGLLCSLVMCIKDL